MRTDHLSKFSATLAMLLRQLVHGLPVLYHSHRLTKRRSIQTFGTFRTVAKADLHGDYSTTPTFVHCCYGRKAFSESRFHMLQQPFEGHLPVLDVMGTLLCK